MDFNLDNLDFKAIEAANLKRQEEADKEAESLESAKGNNDCSSGACAI